MKTWLFILFLAPAQLLLCQTDAGSRESVRDGLLHLEDSLHYSVPELPRLCDTTDSEKRQIDIGNCDLYVEIEGQGVPIVLINGGPGGTHHYFHPWFSRMGRDHQVIYYDQRGTGLSGFAPEGGYTFMQGVEDLEKLRIRLGVSRWFVCGFSYGGGLAQMYAATYPEHVRGLVLISSLPLFQDDRFEGNQQAYLTDPEKEMRTRIIKEYLDGKLKMDAFLYNLGLNGDWKRQHYYKPTKPEMIYAARYEWVNDQDFNSTVSSDYERYNLRGVFDDCPIPTLLFEGREDLTWGSEKALAFIENHPRAGFVLIEDAAHMLFREAPEEFFSSLKDFTRQAPAVPAGAALAWKRQIAPRLRPEKP